jgi:site-specific DNA recombinase
MEEAKRRGYHVTEDDIFKEDGYSGALGINERPVLHQLWEKYQDGEYDAIFVYRIDRLSRSPGTFMALRDSAREVRRCGYKGDGFIFVQGSSDPTPEGKLFSNMQSIFAEYEREVIKLRTITGKKKLAKAGKYAGGSQPLGYRWNDKKEKWEIVEDEAKIVKLIYQWYVYGDESGQPLGMVRIAEKLTELGIPTPNQFRKTRKGRAGKMQAYWSDATVQRILTHTVYAGTNYLWRGDKMQVSPEQVEKIKKEKTDGWFEVDFPPIIDKMLWEKAQEKRVQSRGGFNRKRPKPILAGRIFCGLCQHAFHDAMYNKGTKLVFKCNGKLKQYHLDGSPKCDSPVLDGEAVTAEVKKRIIDMLQDKDQMRKAIEEYVGSLERRKEELETLLSPITEQISHLQEKQKRLATVYVDGALSHEDYKRQINELKEQELAVRKRYENYWPEMENLTKLEQNIAVVKEAIEEELFDVRYQPDDNTVTENMAFVKIHDEKHLTVGFPQRVVTWEELLDRLQVKLWVYPDRLEVRGIVPIEDIANPKCC